MVKKLEACPVTLANGTPPAYSAIRDNAMHSLGIGTTHDMKSVISGIFIPSLKCQEYTLSEKVNMWVGKSRAGISIVWSDILATDLSEKVTELKIPVYFFEGLYDFTCSYAEAKSYFEKLRAPVKGFYIFEKSAHCPFFEEPDKMQKIIMEDILTGANNLADIK
jgi:pimeloyl-ACP methyl ester carboxylesterase